MKDRELLALMATLIDGCDAIVQAMPNTSGPMTPEDAVNRAEKILREVDAGFDTGESPKQES
jgi:hypothetical protein